MEPYENVLSIRNNSENFLRNNKTIYDFIYVDGDHTEKAVYADAIGCWPLLKSGGILAFDDYLWGQGLSPELTPRPAIDRFLGEIQSEYELLSNDYQIWILKK